MIFDRLVANIAFVQDQWGSELTGARKKEIVLNRMDVYVKSLGIDDVDKAKMLDFIDDYCSDLIDILILVIKNKALIKLFKKKCGCFPSQKRIESSEKLIDEMLGRSN